MARLTVGQRIARARNALPATQRELASQAGIAYTQLSRIEKGHNAPRPDTIRKLASALGVSARWLATGEKE